MVQLKAGAHNRRYILIIPLIVQTTRSGIGKKHTKITLSK